jgi:hypothetical protein
MFPRALIASLAVCSLMGQVPKVPEKVDKALRARVNEFFNYHVEGATNLHKAMDMVADDTKEEYFASGKMTLKSFKIDDIKYSDKFDKATVTCTITRNWQIRLQDNVVTLPMVTTWKVEHGKWVWYHDRNGQEWLTMMGPSDLKAIRPNKDGSVNVPKINADTVMAAAQNILKEQNTSLDKLIVNLSLDRPNSGKVPFKNGAPGQVKLELTPMDPVPGLSITLDKMDLQAGETGYVLVDFKPTDKEPPSVVYAHVTIVPFVATAEITINFSHDDDKKP